MDGPDLIDRPDSEVADQLRPSPNHGDRIGRAAPDCLVLHYTGMSTGDAALRWLCDPASSVSCHYVVEEDGTVLQLVAESRRAWHAGRSFWAGETDLNSASVGIEIVNPGHDGGLPAYPAAQVAAVARLARDIVTRNGIAPERVLAHSDIAPSRKQDPGERFPWAELAAAGVGLWVPPRPPDASEPNAAAVAAVQRMLAAYGYGVPLHGALDPETAGVVRAFQRRFRPARIDGRPDPGTLRTLADLIGLRDRSRAAA